ncbi:right-handed parallel beta-helix repeat-containing protein [Capnocytophaga stomatis]|uniref:right-handed parallel beta-helix repeat-containing protein n=1 Tax=Capnocytophaga stomatis TaxID=1848904 RepID=UPI003858924F
MDDGEVNFTSSSEDGYFFVEYTTSDTVLRKGGEAIVVLNGTNAWITINNEKSNQGIGNLQIGGENLISGGRHFVKTGSNGEIFSPILYGGLTRDKTYILSAEKIKGSETKTFSLSRSQHYESTTHQDIEIGVPFTANNEYTYLWVYPDNNQEIEYKNVILQEGNVGTSFIPERGSDSGLSEEEKQQLKQEITKTLTDDDIFVDISNSQVRVLSNKSIQFRLEENHSWRDVLNIENLKDSNNKQVEVRIKKNIIQWKFTDISTWNNLIHINDLVSFKQEKRVTPTSAPGDLRNYLQIICNIYDNVIFSNGTYEIELIGKFLGITPKNGITLTFEPEALIKVLPNNLEWAYLFNLRYRKNIRFVNPNLEGDKYTHLGTTGQWGFGINVEFCENVWIENPRITKFWGDAIFIKDAKNVQIFNPKLPDNRRQGISIVSCDGLEIHNPHLKDTSGQAPAFGIDVEPDWNDQHIKGLKIYNPIFENNGMQGGGSYLAGFMLSTHRSHIIENPPKTKTVPTTFEIEMYNPTFIGDALSITAYSDLVVGYLKVVNPVFTKSRLCGIFFDNHKSKNFYTRIENPKFYDCCTLNPNDIYTAPITFYNNTVKKVQEGGTRNITILNPEFYASDGAAYKSYAIRNVTDNKYENDMENVVIDNVKVFGYNDVFVNNSGGSATHSNLHKSFKLTVNENYLPESTSNVLNQKNIPRVASNYVGTASNASIYLDDEVIPITGIVHYYMNSSESVSQKVIFGKSATQKQSVIFENVSKEQIDEIVLPKGGFIKMMKVRQGVWNLLNKSLNVKIGKDGVVSKSFNPETIDAGAFKSTVVDFPSAVVGDFMQATFSQYNADLDIKAVVSEANKVTVFFKNTGQSPIVLSSGEIKVRKL